jgi:hypothetical protein
MRPFPTHLYVAAALHQKLQKNFQKILLKLPDGQKLSVLSVAF